MKKEKLKVQKKLNMYFVNMMEYISKNKNRRNIKEIKNLKSRISKRRKIKRKIMELS